VFFTSKSPFLKGRREQPGVWGLKVGQKGFGPIGEKGKSGEKLGNNPPQGKVIKPNPGPKGMVTGKVQKKRQVFPKSPIRNLTFEQRRRTSTGKKLKTPV